MKLNLEQSGVSVPSKASSITDKAFESFVQIPLPKGLTFAPTYLQAILIAVLIFLLILTLGQLRRRLVNWQLGGIIPGIIFGFTMAVILEGIFVLAGRTILTEVLGWENAPKPIVNALDAGRGRMAKVLGVTQEVPPSEAADKPTLESVKSQFETLSSSEKESFKSAICKP
jgi:hypothetical protein